MPNIAWNAKEYQQNFSFVPSYGEAVTELITKPQRAKNRHLTVSGLVRWEFVRYNKSRTSAKECCFMAKTNETPKAEDNAELRTISLLKILNTYSDENHELSTKNIMDKLQKECGVTVHRTTVGKNIKQLADCGFDIYTHKTTQNRYYLASRLFEMPELKLLADAVESAGFITEKKSEELIEKLCRLTSVYEAEALQEGFCANNGKSCNESIYYIADTINAAIAKRKKIAFYYFHYGPGKNRVLKNDGKPYVFSPYKLVWNTDEYYVVGYSDKHEKLVSFRVDRIDRCPEILDEDAEPRPEKEELMRHIRTMTSMYDSRRERVTLLCDNAMMNAVVDAFGEDVETKAFGDDAFTVETETAASPVFYRWVFGYGGKIRITEPENVKKEYAEMVKSAAEGLLLL